MKKAKGSAPQPQSINDLLAKYGQYDGRAGSDPKNKVLWIPTGITALDKVLGGGIPRNRISIFLGDFAAGKTFICQKAIAALQSQGGMAAFIDAELKMDQDWFATTGIDTDKLLVFQNSIGEEVLDLAMRLVGDVDLLIIDSLAALVPTAEATTGMDQDLVAAQARMINKFFRKVLPKLNRVTGSKCAVVFINQVRSGIGGFIPIESYPGGRAQKFFSSIILRVTRAGWVTVPAKFGGKDVKQRIGFDIVCKTEKNSLSSPFKMCSLPFSFDGSIDEVRALGRVGVDLGLIRQEGPIYLYGDIRERGRGAWLKVFRTKPDLQEKMRREILEFEEFKAVDEDDIEDE